MAEQSDEKITALLAKNNKGVKSFVLQHREQERALKAMDSTQNANRTFTIPHSYIQQKNCVYFIIL